MTHLEILTEAFNKCGISFVLRDGSEGWVYLFFINPREKEFFETADINTLQQRNFIEFLNGEVAPY